MKISILSLFILCGSLFSAYGQIDEQMIAAPLSFGNATAISGNWAIIGNEFESQFANAREYPNSGSVSFYERQPNGSWTFHSKLFEQCWFTGNTITQHGVNYGRSVSIDGDWAVVGSEYDSNNDGADGADGAAFVYHYNDISEAWEFHQKLYRWPATPENSFGWSVSIHNNRLAISDPFCIYDNLGGRVYTYYFDEKTDLWEAGDELLDSQGGGLPMGQTDLFGFDVKVWNQTVVVGAPKKGVSNGNLMDEGAVFIYTFSLGAWTEEKIAAPDAQFQDRFGHSVDIKDDYLIVGAPGTEGSANATGLAFVYKHNVAWDLIKTLVNDDNQQGDAFGFSVATGERGSSKLFLVGAPYWDGLTNLENARGACWLFDYQLADLSWSNNILTAGNGSSNDVFGDVATIEKGAGNSMATAVSSRIIETLPSGYGVGAVYFYSLAYSTSGVWTAAGDDDEWDNTENWSDDQVPNGLTNVTIPDGISPPNISGNAFCRNLSIPAGRTISLSAAANLRVNGDLSVLGEFVFSDPQNQHLPQLDVMGKAAFHCEKNKLLPGGNYHDTLNVTASSSSYYLTMAGDAYVDQLKFNDNSKGKLQIGDRTLTLYDLVWGKNPNGLYSTVNSNLVLAGSPVIAVNLSSNVRNINNLTVYNTKGIKQFNYSSIKIYGTLTLIDSPVILAGNNGGPCTMWLYHKIVGSIDEFQMGSSDSPSSLYIYGDDTGFQLPSNITELLNLIIVNPNAAELNNNLHITGFLYLSGGQLINDVYQVSFGSDGQLHSGQSLEISEGMIDPNFPPSRIWVRQNTLTLNADLDLDDLDVAVSSTGFILGSGKKLSVNNSITAGKKLTLRSGISGNASLIDNTPTRASVEAAVENLLTSGKWHYVSAPVQGAKASSFYFQGGSPSWLKYYDEATDNWVYINSLTEDLVVGKGYAVWVNSTKANENAVFDGFLNKGDQGYNLSWSGVDKGWNLIGNPFPSALDWDANGWNQQNTSGIAYVWNDGNYLTRNLIGQGTLSNGIIPSGQGFFVQAMASNASIVLPQQARVHADEIFYKEAETTWTDAVNIKVETAEKSDQTWLSFDERATNEFDLGMDAERLDGSNEMPQLYTKIGDKKLSINMMASLVGTRIMELFFVAPISGTYSLSFEYLESFANCQIILKDKLTGNDIDLNAQQQYSFTARPDDPEARFTLHFNRSVTGIPEDLSSQNTDYEMYSSNGNVFISYLGNATAAAAIHVYDLAGRTIARAEMSSNGKVTLPMSVWRNKMIVVEIVGQDQTQINKLFIQ